MGKLDDRIFKMTEDMGEIKANIKNVAIDMNEIKEYLRQQNCRIKKIEIWKATIKGSAAAISLCVSVFVGFLVIVFNKFLGS